MSTESLEITVVEDGDGTNKLTTAVNQLAAASDKLADSTDKTVASTGAADAARGAEAATVDKATTATKGYIDAQGNYIRLVGSQANGLRDASEAQNAFAQSVSATSTVSTVAAQAANTLGTSIASVSGNGAAFEASVAGLNQELGTYGVATQQATVASKSFVDAQGNYIRAVGSQTGVTKEAHDAQLALSGSLSTVSIEAGRAAAGYGPLNGAAQLATYGAGSFSASVKELNKDLGTFGTVAIPVAASTNNVGTSARNAATGTQALTGATTVGQQAVNAWRAANTAAGDAVDTHSNKVVSARTKYGAFNEMILSTIRQLGVLALAYSTVKVVEFASEADQAANSLRTISASAAATSETLALLTPIQRSLGIDINSLAAGYTAGANAFRAINQDSSLVIPAMQQISNAVRATGASTVATAAASAKLFDTFKSGYSSQATLQTLTAQYPGLLNILLQSYKGTTAGANDSVNSSNLFRTALSNGTVSVRGFAQMLNEAVPLINQYAKDAGVTVPNAFAILTENIKYSLSSLGEFYNITKIVSGSLVELAQRPGLVIAALGGIAAAIATIGLGAFVAALTTLGAAFVSIATVAGSVLTVFGLMSAGTAAVVYGIGALSAVLYINADSIASAATAAGGFNTVMGTVLSLVSITAQGVRFLVNTFVQAVTTIGGWISAAASFIASMEGVASAIAYVKGLFGDAVNTVSTFFKNLSESAKSAVSDVQNITSKTQDYVKGIGTTSQGIGQLINVTNDGRDANTAFAGSIDKSTTSAGSLTEALAKMAGTTTTTTSATQKLTSAQQEQASQLAQVTQNVYTANNAYQAEVDIVDTVQGRLTGLSRAYLGLASDTETATEAVDQYTAAARSAISVNDQLGASFNSATGTTTSGVSNFSGAGYDDNGFQIVHFGSSASNTSKYNAAYDKNAASRLELAKKQEADAAAARTGTSTATTAATVASTAARTTAATTTSTPSTVSTVSSAGTLSVTTLNVDTMNVGTQATTGTAANSNTVPTVGNTQYASPTYNSDTVTNSVNTVVTPASVQPVVDPTPQASQDQMQYFDPISQSQSNSGNNTGYNSATNSGKGFVGPINLVIKADDYDQFKRSQKQIAQDMGARIAKAS